MTVRELISLLSACPPDARVVFSGDPEILGDGAETLPCDLCPTVRNLGIDGTTVILWPDRALGDTEPWVHPEFIDPRPSPVLRTEAHRASGRRI